MIPGGLRTKLVLAFASIILLCLGLAGSAFVYLLQPYQTQQALIRLGELAVPITFQVRILETQGAGPREIASYLDDQANNLDVRILLLRQADQVVIHDTEDTLDGDVLVFGNSARSRGNLFIQGTVDVPGEGTLALVSIAPAPPNPGAQPPRGRLGANPSQFSVALAAPQSTLAAGWLAIAPQLRTAALISLFASIAAAFLIARSITGPLSEITRASEAMARGDYNQQIPVRGRDEVARLASAFNLMAQQVSRSNRTLRDFLADVSHELRTPLTTIQGFAQAILDGTARDPHDVAESVRIISNDAARMHRMVEDLLYLSRIESGQLSMDVERVDLVQLVEGAVKRARQRTNGRTMRLEAGPSPLGVTVDPHRIEQVLDNLLSNAIKHSPPDGDITVCTAPRGPEVHVRVHNTGSVVRPQDRDRIFERFFRAGDDDGTSTGLGLAIASQIARSHGGRIDVESAPQTGTAFTLVLPSTAVVPSAS
jgi:signal transduction histidine kinase